MDRESTIALQKIDCNCNDCKFFVRDASALNASKQLHRDMDTMSIRGRRRYFWEEAHRELKASIASNDPAVKERKLRKYEGLLKERANVSIDTSYKTGLVFGNCAKFNKPIATVPNACQPDTQECFEHRRG